MKKALFVSTNKPSVWLSCCSGSHRLSLFPGMNLDVEEIEDAVGVVGDGGGPVGEHSDHPDVAGEHVQHCQHVRVLRDGVGDGLEARTSERTTRNKEKIHVERG